MGIDFAGGDFEVGDINADGWLDIITLPSFGDGTLSLYLAVPTENGLYYHLESTLEIEAVDGDIDLGNIDDDRNLEVFLMYRRLVRGSLRDYTAVYNWNYGFRLITGAGADRCAEGDGHFVDLYSDGYSDVLAMGRKENGKLQSWLLNMTKNFIDKSETPDPVVNNIMYDTDTGFGDVDGDGDLDMLVCGTSSLGAYKILYIENEVSSYRQTAFDVPPPQNIEAIYDPYDDGYRLSWEIPDENSMTTPNDELQYEIQVLDSSGSKIVVSWTHGSEMRRQAAAVEIGGRYERFVKIPEGHYYWNVRAIDTRWKRSSGKGLSSRNTSITNSSSEEIQLIVNCFPNPATDYISLVWNDDKEEYIGIEIIDLKGRVVKKVEVVKNNQIDIKDLPLGLYTIYTKNKNITDAIKFIKQ